jgi:hypothetical protein
LDYKIINNNASLDCNQGENRLYCSFNRINAVSEKANITYFLKIIDSKDYIKNEKIETISLTQSPYYTTFARNPTDYNNKITYREYFAHDKESMNATMNMWRREGCFEVAIETFLCKDKKIDYMVANKENKQ